MAPSMPMLSPVVSRRDTGDVHLPDILSSTIPSLFVELMENDVSSP